MNKNNSKKEKKIKGISRRSFITRTTMATAAFTILPRHVLGGQGFVPPSDKLNIACIGIGGRGESDSAAMENENVVALCDVDEIHGAKTREKYPKAKFYQDFRVLFDKEKNIDAVTIATPDHNHAIIAYTAMQLGKHVYVEKPLTHTVYEARKLAKAAKEYNVVTQMGNQGHASEGIRLIREWIAAGVIGDVHEIHTWTDRPIWPQGNMKKPEEIPSVPNYLDWNTWIGPAPYRPYHPAYHPFKWRGWWDFGTGALGDMGAHILDQPFISLDLDAPKTVQASSSQFSDQTYPLASIVTWTFPKKGNRKEVTIKWFDGGLLPPRPEVLEPGRKLENAIYYGSKGILMHGSHSSSPRLIPETAMKNFTPPKKTIPRSPGIHQEWIEAIKNGTKSSTDFSYSARLTEMMLLGNIAIRMKDKNTILEYDGKEGRFTNMDEANQYLTKKYPKGWEL